MTVGYVRDGELGEGETTLGGDVRLSTGSTDGRAVIGHTATRK